MSPITCATNPALNRGVLRCFGRWSDSDSYGVKVDIGDSTQQSIFIENRLRGKTVFPESALAAVLSVGFTCNELIDQGHEAADIGKFGAPDGQFLYEQLSIILIKRFPSTKSFDQLICGIELSPSFDHSVIVERKCLFEIDLQGHVGYRKQSVYGE